MADSLSRSNSPLVEVEKLTKSIRVGPHLTVSERLHNKLARISQLTGNAPMLAALRMSADEGSDRILEKLDKSINTNSDKDIRSAEDELTLREFCVRNGLDREQAKRELLSMALYFQRQCGFSIPWQAEESEQKMA